MNELYKTIETLCKQNNETITDMCREAKVPRGNLTDLKMGRQQGLSMKNMLKIAEHFGVSVEYLGGYTSDPINYSNPDILNDAPLDLLQEWQNAGLSQIEQARRWIAMQRATEKDVARETAAQKRRPVSDDDLMFALWGDATDITDEDLEDVKRFAAFVRERKKKE